MTTIEAAAARRLSKPFALAALAAVLGLGLGGCETSGNIFGSSGEATPAVADQSAPLPQGQSSKFAIAPLLGPPDNVSKSFQSQLGAALEKQKFSVAKAPADKSEYTLRGYVVASNEKAKTRVSYIWHVTDAAGKQVHSLSGEEMVPAAQGKDPWAALTPQVVDSISGKTTNSIMGWLSTQGGPAVAGAAQAPSAAGAQTAQQAQGTPPPMAAPSATPAPVATAQPAPVASPTTGSIGAAPLDAIVANVSGAPGDGSVSLTNAMQKALVAKGVPMAAKPSTQTYKVQGKVAVGQPKDGKQTIRIDWEVYDPQGKFYKRVTQNNEIPQGMLDGAWGPTAEAAATAAAETITGLLPKQKQAAATGSIGTAN